MCPCFRKQAFLAGALSLLLSGCTGSVKTGHLGKVAMDGGAASGTGSTAGSRSADSSVSAAGALPTANQYGERADGDSEQTIAQRAVHAWRAAVAHAKKDKALSDNDWKKQRLADEKQAMMELDELEKAYPSQSTIQFMKGQVQEHFDHHEEAIKWYKTAASKNLFSSMTVFKLAEVERKAGHNKEAIENYRKLLNIEPNFGPAQFGLALTLLADDPHSEEAKTLLEKTIESDPQDKDEATKLLKKMSEVKAGASKSAKQK